MINGKYHTEQIYKGKKVVIDLADMSLLGDPVNYEVIAMKNGIDFDSFRTNNIREAIRIYYSFVEKYKDREPIVKPLSGKYAKLRDDLIKAVEVGKAADFGLDGGTCNFDSPSLYLPRWNAKKVEQAAKEAGISCFKWSIFGGARFVFGNPSTGQAERRSKVSGAMCKVLADFGYDVLEYCAMD